MAVLPDRDVELIQFCEAHVPVWTGAPASIGLTAAQVTALNTLTGTARTGYNAALAARESSKAATTTFRGNLAALRSSVADLVRIIKGFAEAQTDPSVVYGKAQIPAPASPTPAPAPGRPKDVTVTLNPEGSITLSWSATDASASSGAFFNIARKLPGQATFSPLGGAPGSTNESGRRMSFTDASVPTSAAGAGAQYVIQGQRGTRLGEPSDAIIVQFGIDGGGAQVSGAELKIAA